MIDFINKVYDFIDLLNCCVQVEYDAVQFLEKNQDRLPAEVLTVLSCSQVALVKALFNLPINKTGMTDIVT